MFPTNEDNDASSSPASRTNRKIRFACDNCHFSKTRCTGTQPCAACTDIGKVCVYSPSNRLGRPKGSRNKRTLEKNKARATDSDTDMSDGGYNMRDSEQPYWPVEPGLNLATPPSNNKGEMQASKSILDRHMNGHFQPNVTSHINENNWAVFDVFGSGSGHANSQNAPNAVAKRAPAVDRQQTHHDMVFDDRQSHNGQPNGHGNNAMSGADMYQTVPDVPQYDFASKVNSGNSEMNLSSTPGSSSDPKPDSGRLQSMVGENLAFMHQASPVAPATCNCVAQYVKLQSQIEDIGHMQEQMSLDLILMSFRQVEETLKVSLRCHKCQQDENKSIFLLFALSNRSLLRSLKRLLPQRGNTGPLSPESMSPFPYDPTQCPPGSWSVVVGKYDVTGYERKVVTDALILHAVGRVERVLDSTRRRYNGRENSISGMRADSAALSETQSLSDVMSDKGDLSLGSSLDPYERVDSLLQTLERIINTQ